MDVWRNAMRKVHVVDLSKLIKAFRVVKFLIQNPTRCEKVDWKPDKTKKFDSKFAKTKNF